MFCVVLLGWGGGDSPGENGPMGQVTGGALDLGADDLGDLQGHGDREAGDRGGGKWPDTVCDIDDSIATKNWRQNSQWL